MSQKRRPTREYDLSSIEVLLPYEAVRMRPGMYVGESDGLPQHTVEALLGELIHRLGANDDPRVVVTLRDERTVTVEDFGPGWAVETPDFLNRLTVCHCGRAEPSAFETVGIMPVVALAWDVHVDVRRGGRRYQLRFRQGQVIEPLDDIGPAAGTGTKITAMLDNTMVPRGRDFSLEGLWPTFDRVALFSPRHRLHVLDESARVSREWFCPKGAFDLVAMRAPRAGVRAHCASRPGMSVDVATAPSECPRALVVVDRWPLFSGRDTLEARLLAARPDAQSAAALRVSDVPPSYVGPNGLDVEHAWALIEKALRRRSVRMSVRS